MDENKAEEIAKEIEKGANWWTANRGKIIAWVSAAAAAIGAITSGMSYISNELSKFTNFRSEIAVCMRDVSHIIEAQKEKDEAQRQRDADMVQHRKENREDFQRLENKIDATCEGVAEVKAMLRTGHNPEIQNPVKLTLKGDER